MQGAIAVMRANTGALLRTAHGHLTGQGRTMRSLFAWLLLAMFGGSCLLTGLAVGALSSMATWSTPLLALWLLFYAICRGATAVMGTSGSAGAHALVGLLAGAVGVACLHGPGRGPLPVAMAAALTLGATALVDGVALVRRPRRDQIRRLSIRAGASLACSLLITYHLSYPAQPLIRSMAIAVVATGGIDLVLGLLTGRRLAGAHHAVQPGQPVARWLPWFGE